jgi:hypothetical protein
MLEKLFICQSALDLQIRKAATGQLLSFPLIAIVSAGTIAIALNVALLSFASAAGISTSHGGLFRLFTSIMSRLSC